VHSAIIAAVVGVTELIKVDEGVELDLFVD